MKIGAALTVAGFSFVTALAGSTIVGTKIVAIHPTTGHVLQTEKTQTVSHSASTLLKRNLYDVFGENDRARQREAIDEIYTDDVVFL